MMLRNEILALATCAAAVATAQAAVPADSLEVLSRVSRNAHASEQLLTQAWENPAIKQFQRDYSISDVSVGYSYRNSSKAIKQQLGKSESTWDFDARSYMKYKNTTLWGEAFYNNGRQHGIRWNETSEPWMVYPYLLADSVGGKMNVEIYSFMGGYASYNGKLAWGGSIGYTAGLYYRNVDPRPRNVTANLHITGGIAYRITGNYLAGASFRFRKYKETNDVTFYSELGQDKVFHLTGLVNDYGRFAGTGLSTYYNGFQYSGTLDFYPINSQGFSASVGGSTYSFNNILSGLNKLPMAHVRHNALTAEAAWRKASASVQAHLAVSRRVGRENMFGDPAAQVYPKIGSHDMYHENRVALGAKSVWEHELNKLYIGVTSSVDYQHVNEIYADPQCLRQVNSFLWGLRGKLGYRLRRTHLAFTAGWQHYNPVKHELNLSGVKNELSGLQRMVESDFAFEAHNSDLASVEAQATTAISKHYAIRTSVSWAHGFYTGGVDANWVKAAVALVF